MPVATVVRDDGTIPAIFSQETDALLVARLESLSGSPDIPSAHLPLLDCG